MVTTENEFLIFSPICSQQVSLSDVIHLQGVDQSRFQNVLGSTIHGIIAGKIKVDLFEEK